MFKWLLYKKKGKACAYFFTSQEYYYITSISKSPHSVTNEAIAYRKFKIPDWHLQPTQTMATLPPSPVSLGNKNKH